MSAESFAKLFQQLNDYGPEIQQWTARVIVGAVMVDQIIETHEQRYLQLLLEEVLTKEVTQQIMHQIFLEKKPPPIPPLDVKPDLSEQLLKFIVEVCTCDKELHEKEIRYIKEAAVALQLGEAKASQLIKIERMRLRPEALSHFSHVLNEDEEKWLAGVTLKLIGADDHIASQELNYLAEIYRRIERPQALWEMIHQDVENQFLELLPKMEFDAAFAKQIMEYLAGVSLIDGTVDDRELEILQQAAKFLDYPETQLHALLQQDESGET